MLDRIVNYLIIVCLFQQLHAVKFWTRSARCDTQDPEAARFDLCQLMADNVHVPRLFVTIRLLKVPVTSIKMGIMIGFASIQSMPLIDNTWDLCAYLAEPKRFKSFGRLFEYLAPFSNINHTCPYNHDIYVTNFTITCRAIMPLPNGRYAINTTYVLNKKSQISANFTFDLEN